MFDVGFWELVILFGIGLMVLGPERMPKVAAKVGRWAGQARRMARNLSTQLRDEIEPFESSMNSMDQAMRKDFSAMRPDVGQTTDEKSDGNADASQSSNSEPGSAGQSASASDTDARKPSAEKQA
jgi:sec-independent protein translocase protein TatB